MYLLIPIKTKYAKASIGDKVEIITKDHFPVILCRIGKMTFIVYDHELTQIKK